MKGRKAYQRGDRLSHSPERHQVAEGAGPALHRDRVCEDVEDARQTCNSNGVRRTNEHGVCGGGGGGMTGCYI